jgi:hypothetical protein
MELTKSIDTVNSMESTKSTETTKSIEYSPLNTTDDSLLIWAARLNSLSSPPNRQELKSWIKALIKLVPQTSYNNLTILCAWLGTLNLHLDQIKQLDVRYELERLLSRTGKFVTGYRAQLWFGEITNPTPQILFTGSTKIVSNICLVFEFKFCFYPVFKFPPALNQVCKELQDVCYNEQPRPTFRSIAISFFEWTATLADAATRQNRTTLESLVDWINYIEQPIDFSVFREPTRTLLQTRWNETVAFVKGQCETVRLCLSLKVDPPLINPDHLCKKVYPLPNKKVWSAKAREAKDRTPKSKQPKQPESGNFKRKAESQAISPKIKTPRTTKTTRSAVKLPETTQAVRNTQSPESPQPDVSSPQLDDPPVVKLPKGWKPLGVKSCIPSLLESGILSIDD